MPKTIETIPVRELQAGDQVINKGRDVYKVIEVMRDEPHERVVRVQWADGGFDVRVWVSEDFNHPVEVIR